MKEYITYSKYSILMNELVNQIKSKIYLSNMKMIYTFIRGGLPIAVHLSHFLNIPVYTDEIKFDFTTYYCNEILVVDDIADTGKTLDGFHMVFPTATLFYKPRSKVKPTCYVIETVNWLVFPWESSDEKPNR